MRKLDGVINKYRRITMCFCAFISTCIILLLVYHIRDIVPFGNVSLTYNDANIQYIDFISYFIDVLHGDNSIVYSMSNMLGDGGLPLFSYYLASPFNLLLIFFSQENINLFFSVVIMLKLATAGATCSYYFQLRFNDKLTPVLNILLSISYALMQYSIAQSSNIMWLDGIYLLPLIMLGIHKLVDENKMAYLSIVVAISILINWYVAGINCLFSIVFFFVEIALRQPAAKKILTITVQYGISMIIGIMISAVTFLPTIVAMRGGKGDFDWNALDNTFSENVIMLIRDCTIGGVSENNSVSMFCGSLALVGCICFFVTKKRSLREKLILGTLLTFITVSYFYKPLVFLFSLLKISNGHWCRYSYLGIFCLIFIASHYLSDIEKDEIIISTALKYVLLYLVVSYIAPKYELNQIYTTVLFILVIATLMYLYSKKQYKRLTSVLLVIMVVVELALNANYLMFKYQCDGVDFYKEYTSGLNNQISSILEKDNGNYRVSQTSYRENRAHLNEGMGYGYWSNTGYTSCSDNRQLNMLEQLGYRVEAKCIVNVETSILPADSLLGVKYVLSSYKINGLELDENIEKHNNKQVYINPYALPMCVKYRPVGNITYVNQFDYHNQLYSVLLGEPINLYKQLEYTYVDEGNKRIYTLDMPVGNYAVYGNLPWDRLMNATINANDKKQYSYSGWMSSSLFYIPTSSEQTEAQVTVTAENGLSIVDSQFYALDLDKFGKAVEEIKSREADELIIENGNIKCRIDAADGDSLFVSIPYSQGWHITNNGEKIEAKLFAGCLMSIPLCEGLNNIEMKYYPPGIMAGIIITFIGLIMLMLCIYVQRNWNSPFVNKMKKIINSSGFRYLFIGGCTTLVNIVSYAILCYLTNLNINLCNVISVSLAIIFAYVANKLVVFQMHRNNIKELLIEFGSFVGARLFTMAIEVFGVLFLYEILGQGEFVAKLEVQIIVLIGNYFISKLLVFRDTEKIEENQE